MLESGDFWERKRKIIICVFVGVKDVSCLGNGIFSIFGGSQWLKKKFFLENRNFCREIETFSEISIFSEISQEKSINIFETRIHGPQISNQIDAAA